ncbi:hypothetical protein ES703_54935 [subsurface metagenome]
MALMKLNSDKPTRKLFHFFLLKFILSIFSLVILSVVLFQLINSMDDFLGPNDENTLEIILVSILIALVLLLSIFEVLTVKEYV